MSLEKNEMKVNEGNEGGWEEEGKEGGGWMMSSSKKRKCDFKEKYGDHQM